MFPLELALELETSQGGCGWSWTTGPGHSAAGSGERRERKSGVRGQAGQGRAAGRKVCAATAASAVPFTLRLQPPFLSLSFLFFPAFNFFFVVSSQQLAFVLIIIIIVWFCR